MSNVNLGKIKKSLLVLSIAATATMGFSMSASAKVDMVGINLSGAGFAPHILPGVHKTNFIYPEEKYFKEWKERGVNLVRFPITWERFQPVQNGEINAEHIKLLKQTLDYAQKYDMDIILDVHNYGRYYKEIIGVNVPYESYADFMGKLVKEFNYHPAILGWDIMNEPHDMSTGSWFTAAQAAIDAIREVDQTRAIFVEGDAWASARRWVAYSDNLKDLKDPSDNIIYQAHMYFDKHDSGAYLTEDMTKVTEDVGVNKLKPFVEWLKANNKKGMIGELGVPSDDPVWLASLDKAIAYLSENCVPTTYWAAGPWWGRYKLSIEPQNGVEKPQWTVLKKHINKNCTDFGPTGATINNGSDTNVPEVEQPAEQDPIIENNPPVVQEPVEEAEPVVEITAEAYINPYNSWGYTKGIWDKSAGFSIKNTEVNRESFVKGKVVKFADSELRKILAVYISGANITVLVDGDKLNPDTKGHPNKVVVVSEGSVIQPPVTPTEPTVPVDPEVALTASLNNFDSWGWTKGIWDQSAGFSIKNTATNVNTFTKGAKVKFGDGTIRTITAVFAVGANIGVLVDGEKLDASKVGYPNQVSVMK